MRKQEQHEQRQNETQMEKRCVQTSQPDGDNSWIDQPSTSYEATAREELNQSDERPSSIIDEDEDECEIGKTRPKPIRRMVIESKDEKQPPKKKYRRKKIIFDKRRSEIAKKNCLNQSRSKGGRWSIKMKNQLEGEPTVILPQITTGPKITSNIVITDKAIKLIAGKESQTEDERARIVEFVNKIVQQADQLNKEKERKMTHQANEPKETEQGTVEPEEKPTDEQFDINNMSITFEDGTILQIAQQQPMEVQQELEVETSLDETAIGDQPPEKEVEEHQVPKRISQMVAELEEEYGVNKDGDQNNNTSVREKE